MTELTSSVSVRGCAVSAGQGKPHNYGTQLITDPTTGKSSLQPIADEIDVDKRRAAVGLEPLAEYAKRFGVIYAAPKP